MKRFCKRTFPLLFAILISACGGGGGGGVENPPPPPSNKSPRVSVIFPPHNGLLTAKETVILRGAANDTDGHVQGVSVNGVEAESMDGYATWTVTVPLDIGDNTLDVRVSDDDEGEAARTIVVKRINPPFPVYPTAVTVDPATGRAFVSDSTGEQVAEIDPETGEIIAMLAGPGIGSGARLGNPHEAVLDAAGNRLFVVNNEYSNETDYSSVVAIDLSTLERTEISGPSRGAGDALSKDFFSGPRSIAFDGDDTLYVLNQGWLYVVDVTTGDREAIYLFDQYGLTYDLELDVVAGLLYLGGYSGRVMAFHTETGEFSVIADVEDGKGVTLRTQDMALDAGAGKLYLAGTNGFDGDAETSGMTAMAVIDLASGRRDAVFLDSPDAPQFTRLNAIASLRDGGLLVLDGDAHSITRLDLVSKKVKTLATAGHIRGAGTHITEYLASAGTPEDGLFVIDTAGGLYRIDPSTGNRERLASVAVVIDEKAGEERGLQPQAMVYDKVTDVLWIADSTDENPAEYLYRFDVPSGQLEAVAFELAPMIFLNQVKQMWLSSDGERLYLLNETTFDDGEPMSEILEVDLKGRIVRPILGGTEAARSLGSGPAVNFPYSAFPHPVDGMIYVQADLGMVRVNLQTLGREVVEEPLEFESMGAFDLTMYDDRFVVNGYDLETAVGRFALWQPGEAPSFFAQSKDRPPFGPVSGFSDIAGVDAENGILLVQARHAKYLLDVETGEYLLMSH